MSKWRDRIDGLTVALSLVSGPAFVLMMALIFFEGNLGRMTAVALFCLWLTMRANIIVAGDHASQQKERSDDHETQ